MNKDEKIVLVKCADTGDKIDKKVHIRLQRLTHTDIKLISIFLARKLMKGVNLIKLIARNVLIKCMKF